MAKRLRSYGEDFSSASRERELDRPLSAAAAGSPSSSSFHHRRWNPEDNGRYRDISWAGARRRTDRDREPDCFDREGSRGFRNLSDHDFGTDFDGREVWRGFRKRIDRDVDGFDVGEGSRGPRKRVEHDWSDDFDHREGFKGPRKRYEDDSDGFDRRRGFFQYRGRDGINRGGRVSPRGGRGRGMEWERNRYRGRERERIHHSENFFVPRGGFPKGFRSQRDRSKIEGTGSSWKRFGTRSREVEDELKSSASEGPGNISRESLKSSPNRSKDVKSPSLLSKDSVELSKDAEKSDRIAVKNGGNGIVGEVEEGELQLDACKESGTPSVSRKEVGNLVEFDQNVMQTDSAKEDHMESCVERPEPTGDGKPSNKEKVGDTNEPVADEKDQLRPLQAVEPKIPPLQRKLSSSEINHADRACGVEVREDSEAVNNGDRPAISESLRDDHPESSILANEELVCQAREDIDNDTVVVQSGGDEVENATDLEVGAGDVIEPHLTEDIAEADLCEHEVSMHYEKDKGKGVDICLSGEVEFGGKKYLSEQNFIASRNDCSESSSTRGFELFSCSNGAKAIEGHKGSHTKDQNEERTLEPLELSLCLANVSVRAPSNNIAPRPNSPPCTTSVQSMATTLCTGSDGFARSISFTGSRFIHNPSCSLTRNSIDHDCEQSVKSRPLFQGVDWQKLAVNDSLPKEFLPYQKVTSNVNGSLHLPTSQGIFSGQQPVRGKSSVLNRSGSLGSLQRQQTGMKMTNQDDVGSPAQTQGTRLDHVRESERAIGEESGIIIQKNVEQVAVLESDFINTIVGFVVSEPIQAIAYKFTEMAGESIACLKEGIQEIILKENHQKQLYSLQGVLRNRSDLTLEILLKCHRVQLEILVAIKTGMADFLRYGHSVSLVDLAEIFLNLKCRNPNCGSELPVDECECKFCSRKDGFCNMCMCVVCYKFDTASNTCGWVGCDSCSHWCHAHCGLHKSYIRNGQSVSSAQGTSEMRFYCVACDHPSEMFGFVKDVFETCALEWKPATILLELEYVKRIFVTSSDPRGKLLHDIASQSFVQLKSVSNLPKTCINDKLLEIYNRIMGFFKDYGSMSGSASASSGHELQTPMRRETPSTAPSKDTSPADNVGIESSSRGCAEIQQVGFGGFKEPTPKPMADELETLVKFIQAEAKIFQSRADDARRKAELLKNIAITKSKKIDDEYTARIAKLQIASVEETRSKKLEELQVLERSYQEYMKTRTRMQEDIKDLSLTMGNPKRSLVNE